ncbi:MAG: virulence RhuM family protein [Ignavibacteriales bacterium]|nr:virulence RhuM family protein [Ignavibacteriales bacterium]
MESKGEIILYKSGKDFQIDVKLQNETVWLSQKLMASLFKKDSDTIGLHIKNIFGENELNEKSTTEYFSVVQKEGKRKVTRNIKYYNLDVIISVGYRVKSKRGTQFRIWANKVLKEYLVSGYVLNEKRLKEQTERVKELEKSLKIFQRVSENFQIGLDEFRGILNVITDYTYALDILDQYDHQNVNAVISKRKGSYKINYADATNLIHNLQNKFGGSTLFGKEKDKSFQSTLATIYQTFDGKELYPSLEEKAANLLYLAIKNHSFVDGNKRIAASIFLMYLSNNKFLYRSTGEKRIADNALVALCLMIAESNPKEKDTIIKIIVSLINQMN